MDRRKPTRQGEPAALSSDSEVLWRALMTAFEDASLEVLENLHAHQAQATQKALDALVRAQAKRSKALADMLQFLDTMDDTGRRRSK